MINATATKIMRRLAPALVLILAADAARAFDVFLPPASEYLLPATKATLQVVVRMDTPTTIDGGIDTMPHTFELAGPTMVRTMDPDDDMIETEIVAMELTGAGGMMLRESPTLRSTGRTMATGESFFDVFVDVEVPGLGMLHNMDPVEMRAMITHVPPLQSIYFMANRQPVDLMDENERPVAQLVAVKHDVNGVPKPESGGEFSRIFSCFYECKPRDNPNKDWREITSLLLVNQSTDVHLLADILFVDGRQNAVGRTRTILSPLDLDEINVCATLDQVAGAVVPQAGVIEVLLSPTGGAYGWVKNLTGRFRRAEREPFAKGNDVVGIGKTDCRLVGPNVTTPEKLRARMENAPVIDAPVLVEETDDGPPAPSPVPG